MRYMMMRKADAATEQGVLPSAELLDAMAAYNERMHAAGVFVSGDGLKPSSEGFRIQFVDGVPTVIRGPFEHTPELLAGYTMIKVSSEEEAIQWAKQWPELDGDACIELRRYYELEDFTPGPEIDRHRRLGDTQSRLPVSVGTHLAFPGTCRDAMRFYASVFGAPLEIESFEDTPMAGQIPPGHEDKIVHAELNLGGYVIMGADMMPGCGQQAPGAAVQLQYDDVETAKLVFNQLAEGGSIQMPFEKTFWADGFGMLTDRFGTHWMINCGSIAREDWQ